MRSNLKNDDDVKNMKTFLEEKYKLLFGGEQISKIIKSEKCQKFVMQTNAFTSKFFYNYFVTELEPCWQKKLDLSFSLLRPALENAYIDLYMDDGIHRLVDGPSPERKAAAIACWLNRFHPIQIIEDPETTHISLINPIFAVRVGLSIAYQMRHPNYAEDIAVKAINPDILSTNLANDLIYQMTWRNPGYHQLSLHFQLIL
ncbi:MAG: hypothetical protein HQL54_10040 [Magnetococcales bacterium]|nr:hypothetical protein [Magnetococcales bacterium]